jgi:hypothetical protein
MNVTEIKKLARRRRLNSSGNLVVDCSPLRVFRINTPIMSIEEKEDFIKKWKANTHTRYQTI